MKSEHITGPDHAITRIPKKILAYNYVQINDTAISKYNTDEWSPSG
jgi:hypothetical protein